MAVVDPAEFIDRVDSVQAEIARRVDSAHRAEFGQFFTPSPIARFMAGLAVVRGRDVRLLDAGAGIGSLPAAWIAHACALDEPPRQIHLTCYESDPRLIDPLRETLQSCAEVCDTVGVGFQTEILEADFIKSAVDMIADRPLIGQIERRSFNYAILNPPYRKLHSATESRRSLASVGIETSNLYTAFLWLAGRLLDDDGELIAITPRSFCNGPYFRSFREAFLRKWTLRRIHVFESRKAAFKDSEVLQENVIFRAVKSKVPASAVISSSEGPDDPDIVYREVTAEALVGGPDSVIHIVPDSLGVRFAQCMNDLPATLPELDVQVSTGRVVDFRSRDALAYESNGKTVPLIYPIHFSAGFIAWPKPGKKPNYLELGPNTDGIVVPPGTYVLVKRFSAKEEKRRIVAAFCDPDRLPGTPYGFENHLNYFHRSGNSLSATFAKGLAAYLNSTLVDTYFRQFSGHTQVNAADLRGLRYPDEQTLERIGSRIADTFPEQDEIDAILGEETNMTGDDPVKVRKRIDEALSVLTALGFPKAQLNERSALTLLALLDLEPARSWKKAASPLRGITPIMDWFAEHYGKRYAPNSRETVRRQTVHQFLEAGIIVANPDEPLRPINSGKTVYQIESGALELLRTFGKREWEKNLCTWLSSVETLKTRYAREREMRRIPLKIAPRTKIELSPGGQNVLVKQIVEEFCPRFTPGGKPIYIGDTDTK